MSLAAAVRIGQALVARALWHEDRCNWIGPAARTAADPFVQVHRTLGPDLYRGTAGLAWFLAHLYSSTREQRFRRTALGAIRHSLAAARGLPLKSRISFYAGSVGIAFVAVELAMRLNAEDIEREAVICLRDVLTQGGRGSPLDLVSGAAGAIAALPILSIRVADERLMDLAMALAERTLRRAEPSEAGLSWLSSIRSRRRNLTGFAHGAAGIAYSLLELFAATGLDRYREGAEEAFKYERSWFDQDLENWPDFRDVPAKSRSKSPIPFLTQWCHGAPGIALSRIRAWELLRDARYRTEAQTAIRTTRSALISSLESERDDFSLCHGVAGIAEILHESSMVLEGIERAGMVDLVDAGARASEARARSWHTDSPSLFLGLAGVGYLNLRLHDSHAPSLLMLRREQFV